MSWQTGTSNEYKDLLTKLVAFATGNSLSSASVGAGGVGYTVGDVLTLSGGTFTFAATVKVTTVSLGVVTGVKIMTGGAYTVNPSSPAATTGGTGTGCTIAASFASNGWTALRDTTPSEKEVILQGSGSGSDTIIVGIKTYQQLGTDAFTTCFSWTCVAMTGFNSGLTFENQPGVSPGALPASTGGAYVPLKNTDAFPMSFWFSVTPRRIIVVAKLTNGTVTSYSSCYLGFQNQFGTASEFPYPILVAGTSARHDVLYFTTNPSLTGLTEVMGINGKTGPMYYRTALSVWQEIKNSVATDSGSLSRAASQNYTVYPCGQANDIAATADDIIGSGGFTWTDVIPNSGLPGTASLKLQDSPGSLKVLIPATIVSSQGTNIDVLGELDGVFWFSAVGGVAAEDTLTQGANTYRAFPNGNRSLEFSFMAIKES